MTETEKRLGAVLFELELYSTTIALDASDEPGGAADELLESYALLEKRPQDGMALALVEANLARWKKETWHECERCEKKMSTRDLRTSTWDGGSRWVCDACWRKDQRTTQNRWNPR